MPHMDAPYRRQWDGFDIFLSVFISLVILAIASFLSWVSLVDEPRKWARGQECEGLGGVYISARDLRPFCLRKDAVIEMPQVKVP